MRSKIIVLVLLFSFVANSCSKQNSNQIKKVGVSLWIENEDFNKNYQGFLEGLALGGYQEGTNLKLFVENPQGNIEEHKSIIRSFGKENVDLIFTRGTSGTLIAKELANKTPLIFSIVTFPVKAKILNSIDEASNKIAGTSNRIPIDYQYKIFSSLSPKLKSIAFIRSKEGQPNSEIQLKEFKTFLATKGIEVLDFAATDIDDLKKQLNVKQDSYDAIYGSCDAIVQAGGEEPLAKLALKLSKPSYSCNKSSVSKGFLAALVTDYYSLGKEAGLKAAEILNSNGKKKIFSSDISTPILNINTEVASKLGITVPEELKRTINISLHPTR